MSSRARILLIVVVLAAITVPFKFLKQAGQGEDAKQLSAELQSFLSQTSDAAPVATPLTNYWIGWRFSLNGCEAQALPAPTNGVFDQRARLKAKAGERVSYVFRGKVTDKPPILSGAWNRTVEKLLVPLGLTSKQSYYMIVLIAPEGCADAIEALAWPGVH